MDEPTTTPEVLGRRLQAGRQAKGMTIDDVIDRLKAELPRPMVMSRGKLSQMEKGHVAKPDPFDVQLLAVIYEIPLEELSPQIAEQIAAHRRFVLIPGGDHPGPGSPCTPEPPRNSGFMGLKAA